MVPWGNGQQLTVPGAFGAYRETRRGSFGSETSSSNASFNPNPQWNHGGPHEHPTVWDGQLTVPESYGQMRRGSFSGSETSSSAPFSPNPQWDYSGAHDHTPGSPMVPWGNGQQLTIPSPALYRDRRPSLSGSETSSNAPFSPNYQWDHPSPSFLSDHDDMRAPPASASDADSQNFHQDMDRITRKSHPQFPGLHDFAPVPRATPPERSRTTSSSDTARPTGGADNQQEIDAITEDLRSSFPGFHDSAAVYNVAGPSHHNPTPSSSVAGPSLAHRKPRPGYRHSVTTEASRKAAYARRKHKDQRGAFVCDDCGRDFTAKHNLKNHKNSHDSIKRFACDLCGSFFGTKHVLKRHASKCKKGHAQEGT
ncbi:hypothetical protein C8R46DRAFT_237399 [Mycena filopes]|nr:hypothetical protein C8R46DRAFT_237399 [Mycena filopes]